MGIFNEPLTPQEQLKKGRISFSLSIKLTQLAYLGSKNKLSEFLMPALVMIITILISSKLFFDDGREPTEYIGIPMMFFTFSSFFAVKIYGASKGLKYLGWIEFMFGPRTSSTVLLQFLAGEHYDTIRIAKAKDEYEGSVYAKGRAPVTPGPEAQ